MAETVAGTYKPIDENHDREVFQRIDPPGDSPVLLYFWDDRDGPDNAGWWFGPEVGGEEVWAHNSNQSPEGTRDPPLREWRVLHSGNIDPALRVAKAQAGPTGASPSQAKRPAPPAPSQPPSRPRGSAGLMPTPSVIGAGRPSASSMVSSVPPRPGFGVPRGGPQPPISPPRPAGPGAGAPWHQRGGPPVGGPSGGASGKRPRVDEGQRAELMRWLESLDDGAGAMLQYFEVLETEFDGDLQQIAAAKVDAAENAGVLGAVDPAFWDTVRVSKVGHKMLFARGIAKL